MKSGNIYVAKKKKKTLLEWSQQYLYLQSSRLQYWCMALFNTIEKPAKIVQKLNSIVICKSVYYVSRLL